jgi:hypothetical protein
VVTLDEVIVQKPWSNRSFVENPRMAIVKEDEVRIEHALLVEVPGMLERGIPSYRTH